MADAINVTIVYLVSFIILYVLITVVVLIRFRHLFMDEFRKKFLIIRGYGYARIHGNDKRIKEYFMKLNKEHIEIGKGVYFIDPNRIKFKGTAPVYDFREGDAKPIDVYAKDMTGTDAKFNANFLDAWMFKMKSLAKVTAAKEMQMLLYVAGAAAIAGLVTAVISYTNHEAIQEMLKFLIK